MKTVFYSLSDFSSNSSFNNKQNNIIIDNFRLSTEIIYNLIEKYINHHNEQLKKEYIIETDTSFK